MTIKSETKIENCDNSYKLEIIKSVAEEFGKLHQHNMILSFRNIGASTSKEAKRKARKILQLEKVSNTKLIATGWIDITPTTSELKFYINETHINVVYNNVVKNYKNIASAADKLAQQKVQWNEYKQRLDENLAKINSKYIFEVPRNEKDEWIFKYSDDNFKQILLKVKPTAELIDAFVQSDAQKVCDICYEQSKQQINTIKEKILKFGPEYFTKLGSINAAAINNSLMSVWVKEISALHNYKTEFPLHDMERKFTVILGPTNSGKTYTAMQTLCKAESGTYLAPLRLMALEGYETLLERGLNAGMVTGEELSNEHAEHTSRTIEMADFSKVIDVAIIDEAQMLLDPGRGWAWTAAICGVPAKHVFIIGAPESKNIIHNILTNIGVTKYETITTKRKTELKISKTKNVLNNLKKGDAIVAFSRREILGLRNQLVSAGHKVAVVYGSLSPEARRNEAERFRNGDADILVASDAIGMGLNLPIQRIIFSSVEKYDGKQNRKLTSTEVKQIAGRAGRYGHFEEGHVTAFFDRAIPYIETCLQDKTIPEQRPIIAPTIWHLTKIKTLLQTELLAKCLTTFIYSFNKHTSCAPAELDDALENAQLVDKLKLSFDDKFIYSLAPTIKDTREVLYKWAVKHDKNMPVSWDQQIPVKVLNPGSEDLSEWETFVKKADLYCWLSWRFKEKYIQRNDCMNDRAVVNTEIIKILQSKPLPKKCPSCGTQLTWNYPHKLCNDCFFGT